MRKTIVVLSALMLLAVPVFGQWHSDFRVTNNSGSSYTPYSGGWGIAADDADVYITWYDYSNSPNYARLHDFPIGSPSQTPNGEAVSTYYAYTPVISIHDGEEFVSWYYYTSPYYLKTRERNGSWGSIINHGYNRYSSYYPATATDADGNLHCVFNRYNRGYQVYYQRKNSGSNSFTSPVQVHYPGYYRYAYYPSICVTSDGVIHSSFGSNNGYRLLHAWSTDNGASWNTENVTGTYGCYYSYATSICCDSDDNLYIAYVRYNTPRQTFVVSGTTGNWGTPDQVSNTTYRYTYYPSICCDTSDNIWVCWDDRSGSTYEIYYNRMDGSSGTWDGPSPLTIDDGQYSRRGQFTADENGNVHICWYDRRDGNYEIYYNWYGGGSGPGPGGRDLACTRILKPVGNIAGDPITPEAVIVNFGGDPDSGYAICEITGPGANYDKGNVEGPIHLEPGEEDNVTFPEWTPPGGPGDEYRVTVTVYLWPEETTEDDNPENNTEVAYCKIEGGLQVDCINIIAPEEGVTYDHLEPAATFENTGTEIATDFYCYCEIYPLALMTEPYIDSSAVASLDIGETIDMEFPDWFCGDSLAYEARFYAAIPAEPERELLGLDLAATFQGCPWEAINEMAKASAIALAGENPAHGSTDIRYSLSAPTDVNISIYDVSGALIQTIHDGNLSGEGLLHWDAQSVGTGIYFVRITTPEFTRTIKLVMVK